MPDWLPPILLPLLGPLAALAGSYLGAREVGRRQYRNGRRIEAAETVLGLLHELRGDFFAWLDQRGFVGTPFDKRLQGQLFTTKLNRLTSYRAGRSAWLDGWADRETVDALDRTVSRMSDLSRDYFNTLPAFPDDVARVPPGTFTDHERARERALRWLEDEMPGDLRKIESGLIGGLGGAQRSSWFRRFRPCR